MGSLIGGGFEQASKVPGSRFLVLDAQKTGNVFYLHVQNVLQPPANVPRFAGTGNTSGSAAKKRIC